MKGGLASQRSDRLSLAQPFGRPSYVVNTIEAVLFSAGGKISAGPMTPKAVMRSQRSRDTGLAASAYATRIV